MSPWSTDVRPDDDGITVTVMLSLDPGPMREFRPFLEVQLDEAHATELFCNLGLALDARRARQAERS